MCTVKATFRESATLALYIGLALSGWQTALASASMRHELANPLKWIHFNLYSLGGFVLFGFALLIPGILCALIVGAFRKTWAPRTIRRFLLASAIGSGLILDAVFLKPALVTPVISSTGSPAGPILIVAAMIVLTCAISAALSVGVLGIFESLSARAQWTWLWGWWLFMAIVPAAGSALSGLGPIVALISLIVVAAFVLLALVKALPVIYDGLRRGGPLRWTIVAGLLAALYLVTFPVPVASKPGQPSEDKSPSVVLITIDTVRPDALDCYPEGKCLRLGSPNIARLAGQGIVFENAYSTAPWTVPSVGSILSGLPPSAHGAVDDTSSVLASGATTLAEILREAGWATHAVVVNPMLGKGSGMDQGFDTIEEEYFIQRDGRRLYFQRLIDRIRLSWPEPFTPNINPIMERDAVSRARQFIRRHSSERFFLWVHLFAPHSTWLPPKEYRDRAAKELGVDFPRRDLMRQPLLKEGKTPITKDSLRQVLSLYAGEIAFADDSVGGIVGELERQGILDRTMVVITADHGEEFYEHDRIEHAHSLYPELLHVPLVLKLPRGLSAGERVDDPVSLVDLAPTILDLAGVEPTLSGQAAEFTGRSLAPVFQDRQSAPRPVFVESPLLFDRGIKGVISSGFLYIGGSGAVLHPREYDLVNDPEGWYDVLDERPDDRERMETLINEYTEMCRTIAERIGAGRGGEASEGLRSLGYIN